MMSASGRSGTRTRLAAAGLVLFAAAVVRAQQLPPKDDPAQVRLGKALFFDARLSAGKGLSCASCHDPKHGWTDPMRRGRRKAPSLLNAWILGEHPGRADEGLFWDGRAVTLEDQVHFPIAAPGEMGATPEKAVETIAAVAGYKPYFRDAFGDEKVTMERIAGSIAAFERTLVSTGSAYDRYFLSGETKALTAEQVAGLKLFFGDARCSICHDNARFSDMRFHNTGVGRGSGDLGRFEVTKKEGDRGAFRTPTLRNLRFTGPYMHDGSLKTLEDVVEFYDRGGNPGKDSDPDIVPLYLTAAQKRQLVSFLDTLNADPLPMSPPSLPK